MIWILIVTNVVTLMAALFLWDEVRHRDRHLRWVDERDANVVSLFERVMQTTVVPLNNFLAPFKQHGMISRNAVTPQIVAEADERIEYYLGFLRRSITAAKELISWEQRHPAPPVSRWKWRASRVSDDRKPDEPVDKWAKPASADAASIGTTMLTGIGPEQTLKALGKKGGGYAIGEGAFGPEVGPQGGPRATEAE